MATDLAFAFPPETYGQQATRSGLAARQFIYVMGRVIDNDYRGNVEIILVNFGSTNVSVLPGARIAQMIVFPTTACSTSIRNVYASLTEAPVHIPPRSLTIGTQDIRQIVTSDLCTCTGIRCSSRVGQEASSAFRPLRPEDAVTDAHSCTLPFKAPQHGKVLSRVRHVLGVSQGSSQIL